MHVTEVGVRMLYQESVASIRLTEGSTSYSRREPERAGEIAFHWVANKLSLKQLQSPRGVAKVHIIGVPRGLEFLLRSLSRSAF